MVRFVLAYNAGHCRDSKEGRKEVKKEWRKEGGAGEYYWDGARR